MIKVAALCTTLALTPCVFAQDELPTSGDIDLRMNANDSTELEVYLRSNDLGFSDVVAGLTFTIRWTTTSPAALGTRTNNCPDGIPIAPVTQETNPDLNGTPTGFNYRTYNGFGTSLLSEWGCLMPQDEWYLVMSVPVVNNDGCTLFEIVNDPWTAVNNRDYYISLGGYERQGIIEPTGVPMGTCATDCLGQVGGTALPGTPCDDGNAETDNDVYTAECVCQGDPSTIIHVQETMPALLLWPNPTNGILNVNGATVVGVSDVLGRRAQLPTVRAKSPGISTMDLSGLPTGVYLVELEQDGARRVERVVKR